MASQFLAHMRDALAHLGRSDCRVLASRSAREDYPKAEHGGRAAQLQRNRCPTFCHRAPARLAGTLTPPGGASAPLGIPARPARLRQPQNATNAPSRARWLAHNHAGPRP
eukprot:scaffold10282_cov44-Phaeocystis_antarctica.AAC.1